MFLSFCTVLNNQIGSKTVNKLTGFAKDFHNIKPGQSLKISDEDYGTAVRTDSWQGQRRVRFTEPTLTGPVRLRRDWTVFVNGNLLCQGDPPLTVGNNYEIDKEVDKNILRMFKDLIWSHDIGREIITNDQIHPVPAARRAELRKIAEVVTASVMHGTFDGGDVFGIILGMKESRVPLLMGQQATLVVLIEEMAKAKAEMYKREGMVTSSITLTMPKK